MVAIPKKTIILLIGWKHPSGDGRHSAPRGEEHGSGTSGRSTGEGCWSCGSVHRKKSNFPTREVKATEDGRGGVGGLGPSKGRAPSGSSRLAVSSGGVVRPGTGTQGPAGLNR